MTLNKSRGEVARQTADAGKEVKEQLVVPSHRYPTQDSNSKSKNYPTYFVFVSTSPYVFYSLQQAITDISLNPHNNSVEVAGWGLFHFTDESQRN